jgi:hypothetical protein
VYELKQNKTKQKKGEDQFPVVARKAKEASKLNFIVWSLSLLDRGALLRFSVDRIARICKSTDLNTVFHPFTLTALHANTEN